MYDPVCTMDDVVCTMCDVVCTMYDIDTNLTYCTIYDRGTLYERWYHMRHRYHYDILSMREVSSVTEVPSMT